MSPGPETLTPAPQRKGRKKWWYNIAVFCIICVFLLVLDIATSGRITWSIYPVAAILFLGIAFCLLNRFGTE